MAAARTPALTIALFDREGTQYVGTYGHADLARQAPVTKATLFQIGSISKTFTAVAAVIAAEGGLLDLGAPITNYLPWFEVRSRFGPIAAHHLLTHTAGIVCENDTAPDLRASVYSLRETEAAWEPGSRFHYSNLGYQVLGLALEAATGRPLQRILQTWIFDPLGMASSEPAIRHSLRPRMAEGCRYLFDDRPSHPDMPAVPADWVEYGAGDGCIASTAGDMARFARMLLNEGRGPDEIFLAPETFENLLAAAVPEEEGSYGYGLETFERDGYTVLGHGGSMPGFESGMWIDREHGVGIVLLSATPYPKGSIWAAMNFWRSARLGRSPEPDALSLPDPARIENAQDYAGDYSTGTKKFRLAAEGERLVLLTGNDRVLLEQRGEDRFYASHPDFDLFLLGFERKDGEVVAAAHGGDWFIRDGYTEPQAPDYPEAWEAYPGHYRAHNPWQTNFRIVLRRGSLLLIRPEGEEETLVPLGSPGEVATPEGAEFRIGKEESPERLRFDQIVSGQALRATLSGCPYYRFFTP